MYCGVASPRPAPGDTLAAAVDAPSPQGEDDLSPRGEGRTASYGAGEVRLVRGLATVIGIAGQSHQAPHHPCAAWSRSAASCRAAHPTPPSPRPRAATSSVRTPGDGSRVSLDAVPSWADVTQHTARDARPTGGRSHPRPARRARCPSMSMGGADRPIALTLPAA